MESGYNGSLVMLMLIDGCLAYIIGRCIVLLTRVPVCSKCDDWYWSGTVLQNKVRPVIGFR